MTGYIVIDNAWRVVQQKELATYDEALSLVEVAAKNQRSGPYRIVQVVARGTLIPEQIVIRHEPLVAVAAPVKKKGGAE